MLALGMEVAALASNVTRPAVCSRCSARSCTGAYVIDLHCVDVCQVVQLLWATAHVDLDAGPVASAPAAAALGLGPAASLDVTDTDAGRPRSPASGRHHDHTRCHEIMKP